MSYVKAVVRSRRDLGVKCDTTLRKRFGSESVLVPCVNSRMVLCCLSMILLGYYFDRGEVLQSPLPPKENTCVEDSLVSEVSIVCSVSVSVTKVMVHELPQTDTVLTRGGV